MTGTYPVPPALCVLIEPAPYMIRLTEELSRAWPAPVRTWFIDGALTQAWDEVMYVASQRSLPAGTWHAVSSLWRELRATRPGIVLVAGWSHPVVLATILMSCLLGARVISMSDTWVSDSAGLRAWAKRLILKLIDRFIPGGQRQLQYLRDLGIAPERAFVGHMSVDTTAISSFIAQNGETRRREIRQALGIPGDAPVFIFVGRLEAVKGPDLLLAAFSGADISPSARLLVVGDGSMRDQVEAAAKQDHRIVACGRLQGTELWAQLAAADVLVVPSRSESWGLVVNEALAAGLAILIADCAGCIDDLIRLEINGLTFPTEDVLALRMALRRLAVDTALRDCLRQNAPGTIAGWTTEGWARNVIAAWISCVNGRVPVANTSGSED